MPAHTPTLPLLKSDFNRGRVLVIVGPTASGKTALAIRLAKKFNGEVISADSRQIYRGMDIGTAKPRLIRRGAAIFSEGIRHHLLDIRNINQSFTAKDFKTLAERAIRGIIKREKLPIVVGGTGLYVKTLVENLNLADTPPNRKTRSRLEKELALKGPKSLYDQLVKLDPEAAYIVDPQNPRRVIRALEIALGGKSRASRAEAKRNPFFDFLEIGLEKPRAGLKRIIEKRALAMAERGLAREVKTLIARYGKDKEPLSAIGYREIILVLEGQATMEEALRKIQANTWRYAKKQIAWFKKDPKVHWVKTPAEAEKMAAKFLGLRPKALGKSSSEKAR